MKKILLSRGFADELRRVVADKGPSLGLPAVLNDVERALITLNGEVYRPVELGFPSFETEGIRIPARIVERPDHVTHDHFTSVAETLAYLRSACGLPAVELTA